MKTKTLSFLAIILLVTSATAAPRDDRYARGSGDPSGSETYAVRQVISDGKQGTPWKDWSTQLPERPIESVSAMVRREGGSRDTYVNLRFGTGQTFEPSRVQVDTSDSTPVTWRLNNAVPNGQPLILKAYNGRVYVDSVTVNFSESGYGRYDGGHQGGIAAADYEKLNDLSEDLYEQTEDLYKEMVDSREYKERVMDRTLVSAIQDLSRDSREFRDLFSSRSARSESGRIDAQVSQIRSRAASVAEGLRNSGTDIDRDLFGEWDDVRDVLLEIDRTYGRTTDRTYDYKENGRRGLLDSLFGTSNR